MSFGVDACAYYPLDDSATPAQRLEHADMLRRIKANEYRVLLVSPEALLLPDAPLHGLLDSVPYKGRIYQLVVDEAHLASEWASFRPCMGQIAVLVAGLRDPRRFTLLTATMKNREVADMMHTCGVPAYDIVRAPVDRPNLVWHIARRPAFSRADPAKSFAPLRWLLEALRGDPARCPKTLILCPSASL